MDPSEAHVWVQRSSLAMGFHGAFPIKSTVHQALVLESWEGRGHPRQREFGRELAKPRPQPVNGGELRQGSHSWKRS